MVSITVFNFISYIVITWGTNIFLNFLYIIKKISPTVSKYDKPIDMRSSFRNNRLLGDSTTTLGFVVSIVLSVFIFITFKYPSFGYIPILVYLGHALGSFIKRRLGKKDGTFVPFVDHGDYMIVSGLVLTLSGNISWQLALYGLLFTYVFHPIVTILAFKMGLREKSY